MKFNFGDLVYVRATGEVGTVYSDREIDIEEGPTVPGYTVRVPQIDKDGRVSHVAPQIFTEAELETFEERTEREVGNIALEQQIRTVTKETYDKWVEGREKVIAIPSAKPSLVQ